MSTPLQPLLHDAFVVLRAPTQAWSAADGSVGASAIDGFYFSDVRIVAAQSVKVGGQVAEPISMAPVSADHAVFVGLARHLDDEVSDPGVRVELSRQATIGGLIEKFTVSSRLQVAIHTDVVIEIRADSSSIQDIKGGLTSDAPTVIALTPNGAEWSGNGVEVALSSPGAEVALSGEDTLRIRAAITVPPMGSASVAWELAAVDAIATVRGATTEVPWSTPQLDAGDDRLRRWLKQSLNDLESLRMVMDDSPTHTFIAAGAPWFLTLFGRDSLWTARFMLPLGTQLAGDTLKVLAGLQGRVVSEEPAEEPGKILHELRRETLAIPGTQVVLPPLYYGTVDATPLWICLLHDAWRWGLDDSEVLELMPNLVAALAWMRDFGDPDGDGLLEYIDRSGHGLANQGWKDSDDSVQWRDGSLAEGPIALCEVQAYAYEAAMHGADLLDHFGFDGATQSRAWAQRLRERFNESFWIEDDDGPYPAIALDVHKQPVDTVTSNIGHLLGTGLLTEAQSAHVAARLSSQQLDSGYGLRTMSTDSVGYWPLSYHGGSVWAHDTAIAISGLAKEGFHTEAASLAEGLLAAASTFHYRMPELHSGDGSHAYSRGVPYPAACRPQAWSAAAAVSVLGSVLGLSPEQSELSATPIAGFGPISVSGLDFRGRSLTIDSANGVSTEEALQGV